MSRTTRIATTALLLIWASAATQPRAQVADDPIWANPLETGVPSPTAAEIGNVALSDVAHQTGALQLSIPLFELPTRSGMTIPITLSYSSNGVKVDDVAGWVGMGWTLHAGGAVTRSVRGLPDEEPEGYPFQGRQDAEAIWGSGLVQGSSASSSPELKRIWLGESDTQPDLFAFSTPGPSGRFIWAAEEDFVPIPYQPVAINDTGRDEGMLGWEITAPDGSRYIFGEAGDLGGREMTTTIGTTDITITEAHSSWMLAKIVPPTGNDQDDFVSFRYSGPHPTDLMQPLWEERISGCGYTEPQPKRTSGNRLEIDELYLSEIETIDHRVVFSATQRSFALDLRHDQQVLSGGQHTLIRIDVFVKDGSSETLLKSFEFDYDYRQSQGYGIVAATSHRMFLSSVRELGSDAQALPPYVFEYEEGGFMPARTAGDQDHWGYPNGNSGSTTLLPPFNQPPDNRDPVAGGGKHGVLTRIVYPTGGFEVIEWGDNYADYVGGASNVMTGGVRVERRMAYGEDGGDPVVFRYEYEPGVATEPEYQAGDQECMVTSSSSLATLGEGSGTTYTHVTVVQEDALGNPVSGKTIHEYIYDADGPDINEGLIPGAVTNNGWMAHPTNVKVYDDTESMISHRRQLYYISTDQDGRHQDFRGAAVRLHQVPGEHHPVVLFFSNYTVTSGLRQLQQTTDTIIGPNE